MTQRVMVASLLAVFLHGAATRQQLIVGSYAALYISDVLAKGNVSGSLEYNGRCSPPVNVPDLPSIHKLEGYAQSTADNFRAMFSVDPRMVVSQERNGTVRVVESGVQTDILHVRIRHVSFTDNYPPGWALSEVLHAPEVASFMQAHGVLQPHQTVHVGGLGYDILPLPWGELRISGELNDVTLSDALDYILPKYPGFWLYQNCQRSDGQRIVYFGLFPVPGEIWRWGTDEDASFN